MTDYKVAVDKVLRSEGLYDNDPDDPGGETFRGISRKYFPDLSLWSIIDNQIKIKYDLNKEIDRKYFLEEIAKDQVLLDEAYSFYKQNFWNRFLGDQIQSQIIAEELMDQSVHLGVHQASLYLQKTLNILNNQGTRWLDVSEDSKIGPNTLTALNCALSHKQIGERKVLVTLNAFQAYHYITITLGNKVKEKYFSGWIERTVVKL